MKRLAFLMFLLIISCSEDPEEGSQNLTAKTDKTNYINSETIHFSINNSNSITAHLASCCSSVAFYVDEKENGAWIEYSNYGLPCESLCPGIDLKINFMEILTDSLHFIETGTFRIRIPYTFNQEENWTGEILSNSFTID